MLSKWWLLAVPLLLLDGGGSSALPWLGQRARPQDTASVNKPDRKEWSQASSPLTDHMYHAAVVVDARVYVVGGHGDVEVFDRKRNVWESLGKNPSVRNFPGAAALGKQIYVVGGANGKKNLATVGVFGVDSKKWRSGVPLEVARSRLVAVAWGSKLYAIGGYVGDGTEALDTGVVEEYEPGKRAWVQKASMPTPRHGHAAVVVNNRILVVGGYGKDASGTYGALSAVEAYDPQKDRWTTKAAMPTSRGFLGAAMVGGKVFAIGGRGADSPVERYDPETDTWKALEEAPGIFQRFGIATMDNDIFLVGGEASGLLPLDEGGHIAVRPPRQMWRFRPQAD